MSCSTSSTMAVLTGILFLFSMQQPCSASTTAEAREVEADEPSLVVWRLDSRVEVNGLQETSIVLSEAGVAVSESLSKLQQTLEQMKQTSQSLSPKEIEALTDLLEEMTVAIHAANELVDGAAESARTLAADAKEKAIEPGMELVNRTVIGWIGELKLLVVVIGVILAAIVLVIAAMVFGSFRRLAVAADNLRSIADEYMIVHKGE